MALYQTRCGTGVRGVGCWAVPYSHCPYISSPGPGPSKVPGSSSAAGTAGSLTSLERRLQGHLHTASKERD